MRRVGLIMCGVLLGCARPVESPAPAPVPAPSADSRPRCIRAGGTCVGPAAIAANPRAPCAAGMHRVDDVALPDDTVGHAPACFGIPMGEEACCVTAP